MSKLNLRRSAVRSASGAGVSFLDSSPARMKWSVSERGHDFSLTLGSGCDAGGVQHQWSFLRCSRSNFLELSEDPPPGQSAPPLIQFSKSWICGADNLFPDLRGGIAVSGSSYRIAAIIRLFSGSPGTIAGPVSPPLSSPSSESRSKFAFRVLASALWQLKQFSERTGRILRSKKSVAVSPAADGGRNEVVIQMLL